LKGLIEVILFEAYRLELINLREEQRRFTILARWKTLDFLARSLLFPQNIKLRPVEKSRFLKMVDFM
jgi:hypothetical protein